MLEKKDKSLAITMSGLPCPVLRVAVNYDTIIYLCQGRVGPVINTAPHIQYTSLSGYGLVI